MDKTEFKRFYAEKIIKAKTHEEMIKWVFQWVKEGRITPTQMDELIVSSWKKNTY